MYQLLIKTIDERIEFRAIKDITKMKLRINNLLKV
jgi:hypothetical protein